MNFNFFPPFERYSFVYMVDFDVLYAKQGKTKLIHKVQRMWSNHSNIDVSMNFVQL